MKKMIRRKQRGALSKEPKSLSELKIEGEWTQTSISEMFLIHDSGAESRSCVVVFASDTGLRHLARQRVWYMDGNLVVLMSDIFV